MQVTNKRFYRKGNTSKYITEIALRSMQTDLYGI